MRSGASRRPRAGVARGEVLVLAGLVLISAGCLLPRVQAARGDADRAQCQENLRKVGQGFLEFEKANGGLPPRRTGFNDGSTYGGWGPFVLAHVGESDLAKKYNFNLDCYDPGNKAAAETTVKTFLCPAAPPNRVVTIQSQATGKSANPDRDTVYTMHGGATDFISCNTLLLPRGGYGLNARTTDGMGGNARQALGDGVNTPLAKITDGLSTTLLLIEQAGRPEVWRSGKKMEGGGQFGMGANARGAWSGWGSIGFGPAGPDGVAAAKGDATDCSVNCNNWFGIYGFHAGGANVLMCDGSVRFVGPKLDPLTFAYLTLRDDGHLISPTDY